MGGSRGHCKNDLLGSIAMQDYCVACGTPVPEGQMVCYECLNEYGLEQPQHGESVEEGDLLCHQEDEMDCIIEQNETSETP